MIDNSMFVLFTYFAFKNGIYSHDSKFYKYLVMSFSSCSIRNYQSSFLESQPSTFLGILPCESESHSVPMDCMVHGILQARILEWVAFPFSRGSSQPRDWIQVSRIAGRFFTSWATFTGYFCYGIIFYVYRPKLTLPLA